MKTTRWALVIWPKKGKDYGKARGRILTECFNLYTVAHVILPHQEVTLPFIFTTRREARKVQKWYSHWYGHVALRVERVEIHMPERSET